MSVAWPGDGEDAVPPSPPTYDDTGKSGSWPDFLSTLSRQPPLDDVAGPAATAPANLPPVLDTSTLPRAVADYVAGHPIKGDALTYRAVLPLPGSGPAKVGLVLAQLGSKGDGARQILDYDTRKTSLRDAAVEEDGYGVLEKDGEAAVPGVLILKVAPDGIAAGFGFRPGDYLTATSATLGNALWPKSTLEGVMSAVNSRGVVAEDIEVEIRRPAAAFVDTVATPGKGVGVSVVGETYEVTVERPLGLSIVETPNGVTISSIADPILRSRVGIAEGDRISHIDNALTSKMYPVSTVAGVVSACASRAPGVKVRLRLVRDVSVTASADLVCADTECSTEEMEQEASSSALDGAVMGYRSLSDAPVVRASGSNTHRLLLSRCREVLGQVVKRSVRPEAPGSGASPLPGRAADRVLQSLASAAAPLDSRTLLAVMASYSASERHADAVATFERATGYAADGSGSRVDATGNELVPNPTALNLYTSTALVRSYGRLGSAKYAKRAFRAMASGRYPGSKPDVRAYNVVLAAIANAGSLTEAVKLFDAMKWGMVEDVPPPDVVSYNTMMDVLAKRGRTEEVYTLFYNMQQRGLKPDRVTYTALMKAIAAGGDVEDGREVLREMTSAGIQPDVQSYNTLIKALCDVRKWFDAQSLIREMEYAGIFPDALTYAYLMTGLVKAGKSRAALTLFESAILDPTTVKSTESPVVYTVAMEAAAAIGDIPRVMEILERMEASGIVPTLKTLTLVMQTNIRYGKHAVALEIYRGHFEKYDIKPDGLVISASIRALCGLGQFENAASTLSSYRGADRAMTGRQIMNAYGEILQSTLREERFDLAAEVFNEFLGANYIPSKSTYESILRGLRLVDTSRSGPRTTRPTNDCNEGLSVLSQEVIRDTGKNRHARFQFLLQIIDAVDQRKVPISGLFYSAAVREGTDMGDIYRELSLDMLRVRRGYKEDGDENHDNVELSSLTWQNALTARMSGEITLSSMPVLRVQIGKAEQRAVQLAEKAAVYRRMQKLKKEKEIASSPPSQDESSE